jgi:hypothetical protein
MAKKITLILLCIVVQISLAPHSEAQTKQAAEKYGAVTITIQPLFNGQPLKLNTENYVNEHSDTLNIETLKFYLTHISLEYQRAGNGEQQESETIKEAMLYDAEDTASGTFTCSKVMTGKITGITFIAGVDSLANTSGANDGDLDPVKGMYWAWNSGYIMAKLEGHSNVCKTLHHAFEYHIGGYMPPNNTARKVSLALPGEKEIKEGATTSIKIKAEVSAWFRGNLNLAKCNSVLMPGQAAAKMADNYAQMFSIAGQ